MAEDDDEIFTNFASWTATYLNHIRSTSRREMDTVPTNAWLTLQAIGPWRIGNSRDEGSGLDYPGCIQDKYEYLG